MVTRETAIKDGLRAVGVDPVPDAVVGRLDELTGLLLADALPRGFLGPAEADRIVSRHIVESAALLPLLPTGTIADVGSGAGLPGLILACLRSDPVVLVEAEGKRASFLERCVRELDLLNTEVYRGRAEDLARDGPLRDACEGVVARALAAPVVALELCMPLCAPGGSVVLLAGPSVVEERSALAETAAQLAGELGSLQRLEIPGSEAASWAIVVRKIGAGPERFPRRPGVAARKPLVGGRTRRRDVAP